MNDYAKSSLFRYRWTGQTLSLREVVAIIKREPNWYRTEAYKSLINALRPILVNGKEVEKDLRGAPLSGADLWKANLSGADLLKANLSGAYLREAELSGANLWGADLSRAKLKGANLSKTNLWEANLSEADLTGANLSGANLSEADLSKADLWKADLSDAVLRGANLSGANLWGVNLSGADLEGVVWTTNQVFNRLVRWTLPKILHLLPLISRWKRVQDWKEVGMTNFGGIDTTRMNGSKNPVLKRYIEDYQFIEGFKKKSWFHRRLIYPLWKATSDCGRSLTLWVLWSLGFIGLFTVIYYHHRNVWFQGMNWNWSNSWYLSVVRFMSLGFENVTPIPPHPAAKLWSIAELVIGYIMLAGLISILVNKLARRA